MTATTANGTFIAIAATLLAITAGTWRWQAAVHRGDRRALIKDEAWERVKNEYPVPLASASTPMISQDLMNALIRANPFSPQRRVVAPPSQAANHGPSGPMVSEAAAPAFLYKGRIDLGQRQRAIVEDLTTHKTHFLEVGQEVAGFKVLDIAQNQVVLSDPLTHVELVVLLAAQKGEQSPKP